MDMANYEVIQAMYDELEREQTGDLTTLNKVKNEIVILTATSGARGKSGSNDANAEYIAYIRRIFEEEKINFQTAELGRVDLGGGGTIAYILALYGMNVIDSGVAVLNMHAPWEATSKADVYEAKRGYVAFLEHASLS